MYDEHPVIQFDTIYEKGLYKIFAMMQVNVEEEDGEVFYYTATFDFKISRNLSIIMRKCWIAVLSSRRRLILSTAMK